MDSFAMTDLRQLSQPQAGPCVTICMPTHVAGVDGQQDVVRLKNLVERAESQLADGWLRAPEARDLLAAVRDLPADRAFWEARSHGLALFLDRQSLRHFRVPIRLDEMALVNRRFHLKPLLSLLTSGDRYFVLALSQNYVRLLAANRYRAEQLEVAGLPRRMDEALNLDGADRGSQSHFAMKGGKGKQSSVFHGQGGVRDAHKDELALFFRKVDEAVRPVLADTQAPLILAGVDYLLPIYRKVCRYTQLADQELAGNWDHLTATQLHEKTWPLAEPIFSLAREQAADRFRSLAGSDRASDDLRQVWKMAAEGRIDTLFVASDCQQWGALDPETNSVELHDQRQAGDDDLLDAAAVQTLLCRGTVYAVPSSQMPGSAAAAAILRYAV